VIIIYKSFPLRVTLYNNHNYILYSSDGKNYIQLGTARDFMSPKEHYFRLGESLRFVRSLKERPRKPRFSQLELFPE